MKVTLEAIGLIKKAEIDLDKNLIVLCGANNTGKTYIAYTVYGLYQTAFMPFYEFTIENIESLINTGTIEINLINYFNNNSFLKQVSEETKAELPNFFAADNFKNATISLIISDKSLEKKISEQFHRIYTYQLNGGYILKVNKEEGSNFINFVLTNQKEINQKEKEIKLSKNFIDNIEAAVHDTLIEIMTFTFFNDVYIAPTERAAIDIFSKELSIKRNELVEEMLENRNGKNLADLLQKRAKRYSLPIRESLKIAEDLKNLSKEKSNYAYLADFLEKELLQGKIKVSKDGEMVFNPNQTSKHLDIQQSASMVKSLSSIVFYLRHLAKENDFIIIDEPELNLHPDNQRKIARFLVRLVNVGFKVMISTHSDYIIKEFNNLIMLNQDNKAARKLMKEFGYHKEELLKADTLGAYLVKDGFSEALEVSETGFSVESIDAEINALNQSIEKIYYTLHHH